MANHEFTTKYTKLIIQLTQDQQIMSNPKRLAFLLRYIASIVEKSKPPLTPASPTLLKPFPPELNDESTAWLWLLDNRPQLFDGIDLSKEPYYHHIKAAQQKQDARIVAQLEDPSQADVAEALFDDRTKTGGSYRRRILAALKAATTTGDTATTPQKRQKAA